MTHLLRTYTPTQQQYGAFFSGFQWTIFGHLTFRKRVSRDKTPLAMKAFIRELGKSVGAFIPYIAVEEHRTSGLGYSPIPRHFHFVAACPARAVGDFQQNAHNLWHAKWGEPRIDRYDPEKCGAFYMAKLASQRNFEYLIGNLDRIKYEGPEDLLASIAASSYPPGHANPLSRSSTLLIRDPMSKLPMKSRRVN